MSFNRSGYIGRAPGDSSITIARKSYEPTGIQTDFTFSAGYDPGYCDVYLNGIKLINGNDYTASNGSTVGLTSEANSGDVVEIVAYKAFNLGQSITDITGDLTISDALTVGSVSASSSITAGSFYGNGNTLTLDGYAGAGITQYIDANSLTVTGTPGLTTITRLGATDAVVTGIITANGLSGNVVGAALTISGQATFSSNVSIAGTLSYQDVTNVDAVGLITARAGIAVTGGQFTVGVAYSVGHAGVATAAGFVGPLTGDVTGDVTAATGSFSSNLTVGAAYSVGNSGVVTAAAYHGDAGENVWTLGASGTSHYTFTGPGDLSSATDPTLNLIRGQRYRFKNRSGGHPFQIQREYQNTSGTAYNDGVTNNAAADGTDLVFDVPYDAPAILYYQCTAHANMSGYLYIGGSGYEISVGSGITFGSAGVATFSGTSDIHLKDNVQLNIGDASDLQIYHNGTNSVIQNTNGILYLNAATSETGVLINPNSSVEINYDNSKKFETTNDGVVITGITTSDGLRMGDDERIKLGDSQDLSIYHHTSHDSYVSNATGFLSLRSTEDVRLMSATNEFMVKAINDGAVEVYYDNSKKLATTNEGIEVTGFTSTTAGMGVTGGLFEGMFIKAGKLSDNKTIGISSANVFYFTTQETGTALPNIIWNDSYSLSSKMAVGEMASVTIITTAASAGYAANWTIDGNAVTEEWVGGSAPSAGGSSGLDIYSFSIIKIGTGTGDSGWKVIANVSNAD